MALTPGARLGLYEVIASIGVGGMGEVFRARGWRISRDLRIAHQSRRLSRRALRRRDVRGAQPETNPGAIVEVRVIVPWFEELKPLVPNR